MAKQTINTGTAPNSGNGDVLRTAFAKVNENFTELYARNVFSGSYNDLTGKPTIPTDVSQLTDTTNLLGSGGGNPNTGNIQFRNDSMSSLTGVNITNADQTTASTASITIPANGAASALSIANNNNIWSFTNDGKLQLPSGGDIVNGLGDSVLNNLGYYKIQGNTIGTQGIDANSWGSHAISIDPGGESWAGIFIPELLSQDGSGSLNIYNNKNANNTINLSVYQGNYTFSPTKLTAPASIELKNSLKIEASDVDTLYDTYQGNLFVLEDMFNSANYTGPGYPASKNSYDALVQAREDNPSSVPPNLIPAATTLKNAYYSWASATANLTASAYGFHIENGDGVGWRFEESTGLRFPDNTYQTTAFTGIAPIARRVRAAGQATIEVTSTGNPDKIWQFSEDGALTSPTGFRISSNQIDTGAFGTVNSISLVTESLYVDRPLEIYSESNRLHIDSSHPTTELYIGDNSEFIALKLGGEIFLNATGGLTLHGGGENSFARVVIPDQEDAPSTPVFVRNMGNAGVRIEAGPMLRSWHFGGSDGAMQFPDNTIQTTAWPGTADTFRNTTSLGGTANIQTASQQGDPAKTWSFDHGGAGSLILTEGSTVRAKHGFNILATEPEFVNFTSVRNFDSQSFLDQTNIVIINPTASMLDAIDPASSNCTAVNGATIRLMLTNGVVRNFQLTSPFVGEQNNPYYGLPVWTATIANSGIPSTPIKEVSIEYSANWNFNTNGSITLPNGALVGKNEAEVAAKQQDYNVMVQYWNTTKELDLIPTAQAQGITAEGWPFLAWDLSEGNPELYLIDLTEAWAVQNIPSSPPTPLIFNPPISAPLYQQMRTVLTAAVNRWNALQTAISSVQIVAGDTNVALGDGKITTPEIIQTNPEEDLIIRTRYEVPSSPPGVGSPMYFERNFIFGTNGTLTFPNGTVQSGASIELAYLKSIVASSTSFDDFKNRIAAL